MIRASLYVIGCSARNRARQRLRRLRETRYLVGAIAGLGYLTFTLIIRQRAYGGSPVSGAGRAAAATLFGFPGPAIGGALLACAALASWLLPMTSGLLEFSRAETSFLFPAPVRRRQLVTYRLLRSQLAVLTGALIMALAYPTGSPAARLRGLLAVWIILMASRVFFTGVTLARAGFGAGSRTPVFAWPAIVLSAGGVLSVLAPLVAAASRSSLDSTTSVLEVAAAAALDGSTRWLLWPFVLLARPLFALSAFDFVRALAGALGVYAVAVAWLFWADSLSASAADASAERQVSQPTRPTRAYVARPVGWQLAPAGRLEVAFVWKGVLQTLRTVDRRVVVRILVMLGGLIVASLFLTRARGLVMVFGVFATWGALFMVFMGPQIIRTDLRQDLAHLELIKTWPLRGAAVLRGEIAWPAMIVTLITWTFGATAMLLSMASLSRIPPANRAAAWLAFLALIPGVVLAQYTLHNAVAVLFPGWVPLGPSRLRGVDAVGQRLIMLAANWVGLLVALAPGIVVTVVLSLWLRPVVGPFILPVGALATTLIIAGEVWLATRALGPVYERLDVTSVERPD